MLCAMTQTSETDRAWHGHGPLIPGYIVHGDVEISVSACTMTGEVSVMMWPRAVRKTVQVRSMAETCHWECECRDLGVCNLNDMYSTTLLTCSVGTTKSSNAFAMCILCWAWSLRIWGDQAHQKWEHIAKARLGMWVWSTGHGERYVWGFYCTFLQHHKHFLLVELM